MEYYSALKRKRILTHATTWMNFEDILKKNFFSLFLYFLSFFLSLAVLGLCCCTRAFFSCSEWELPFVAVCELLIVVASVVVEHGL